jgi:dihydrofolate synthase/folylpolyglutamate synthase
LNHLESLNAQRVRDSSFKLREQRLDRLVPIAKTLDLLNWDCPVVSVGGTNGKGSCVGLLASILTSAGYRVASYTSPHLLHYNERIQVNHQPISEEDLLIAFENVEQTRQSIPLGYFEFTTLAALFHFKQVNPDIIILEVGMGGRFDPVNMIDSDLTLISSVDFDHTHILGNTLEKIAFEKAGIMRPQRPCIWGNTTVPQNVIDYAKHLGTFLFVQGQNFGVKVASKQNSLTWDWWSNEDALEELPRPEGIYLPNAACALQVIELLQEQLPVPLRAILQGLYNVSIPGRFQKLPGLPLRILDVAHNPASAKLLANNLAQLNPSGRILAVMGLLSDKDMQNIISPLISQIDQWFLAPLPVTRTASVKTLTDHLHALSAKSYHAYSNIIAAYNAAVHEAQVDDVIVVFGSFHAVAEILALQELE